MDKDIARLIRTLHDEIAAFAPGHDLALIGIKQTHAGALYAIWMAARHDYLVLTKPRAGADEDRERGMCDAILAAVGSDEGDPGGEWVGEFYFNSALLRVAATTHCTLKYQYMPLFGEGFCRSQLRLELQARDDGLISEKERVLLESIREDVNAYKHEYGKKEKRTVTSLSDLIAGLRVMVGVARAFPDRPVAAAAKG